MAKKQTVESPRFHVGQMVRCREQFACRCSGGWYFAVGPITQVLGPRRGNPTNEKCERMPWNSALVYQYEVDYSCPHCFTKKESVDFWTSELVAFAVPDWKGAK